MNRDAQNAGNAPGPPKQGLPQIAIDQLRAMFPGATLDNINLAAQSGDFNEAVNFMLAVACQDEAPKPPAKAPAPEKPQLQAPSPLKKSNSLIPNPPPSPPVKKPMEKPAVPPSPPAKKPLEKPRVPPLDQVKKPLENPAVSDKSALQIQESLLARSKSNVAQPPPQRAPSNLPFYDFLPKPPAPEVPFPTAPLAQAVHQPPRALEHDLPSAQDTPMLLDHLKELGFNEQDILKNLLALNWNLDTPATNDFVEDYLEFVEGFEKPKDDFMLPLRAEKKPLNEKDEKSEKKEKKEKNPKANNKLAKPKQLPPKAAEASPKAKATIPLRKPSASDLKDLFFEDKIEGGGEKPRSLREHLIKELGVEPSDVDATFIHVGFDKDRPFDEMSVNVFFECQFPPQDALGSGPNPGEKPLNQSLPKADEKQEPLPKQQPLQNLLQDPSTAAKSSAPMVKSEPALNKSSSSLDASKPPYIAISDSPPDMPETDFVSLSDTPEMKEKRGSDRPRKVARTNSDDDFVLPMPKSEAPVPRSTPSNLDRLFKSIDDEDKANAKRRASATVVTPPTLPKQPSAPSAVLPSKPPRQDSDSSSEPPPLKLPAKPTSKTQSPPRLQKVSSLTSPPLASAPVAASQAKQSPPTLQKPASFTPASQPTPNAAKASPQPLVAPLPQVSAPKALENIPAPMPKTVPTPSAQPSVPVTLASAAPLAPSAAPISPDPILKPQPLSLSEPSPRKSLSPSADAAREKFERAMKKQQKRKLSASPDKNPDLDISSNLSDEDEDEDDNGDKKQGGNHEVKAAPQKEDEDEKETKEQGGKPEVKAAPKKEEASEIDSMDASLDFDEGLDSMLEQTPPPAKRFVRSKSKLDFEVEEAREMERVLLEKQRDTEAEKERNSLEVSRGIFKSKVEPKAEAKPQKPSSNHADDDPIMKNFLAQSKGKSGFVSDLRTKCPNLTMIRSEKPRISEAAKKFLPIGKETRAIPSHSNLYFAEAKQFFQLPREKLDAIARKLVIRVRTDTHLMGNHGVFVAEDEAIEEDTFIEYAGIIRTEEETEERFQRLEDVSQYPDRFYHWDVPVSAKLSVVICGFGCGNPAMLFNDPTPPKKTAQEDTDDNPAPHQARRGRKQGTGSNMKAMFFLYEGIPRVLYRATRRIEAGEELLIDYNNPDNSTSNTIQEMNELVKRNYMLEHLLHRSDPTHPDPSAPVYLRDELGEDSSLVAQSQAQHPMRGGRELRAAAPKPVSGPGFEVVPAWRSEPEAKSRHGKKRTREESDESEEDSDEKGANSKHKEDNDKDEDEKGEASRESHHSSTGERPQKRARSDPGPIAVTQVASFATPQSEGVPCRLCPYSNHEVGKLLNHYTTRHQKNRAETLAIHPELLEYRSLCPVKDCISVSYNAYLLSNHIKAVHHCEHPRAMFPFAFVFVNGSNVESISAHRSGQATSTDLANPAPSSSDSPPRHSEDSSSTKRSLKRSLSDGSQMSETETQAQQPPKKKAKKDEEEEDYIGLPDDGHHYKLVSPSKDLLLETKSEDGQWYSSKIQSIDLDNDVVTIRFDGFPRSCDEKYHLNDTERYRPHSGVAAFERVATHFQYSKVHAFPRKEDGSYKGSKAIFVRLD